MIALPERATSVKACTIAAERIHAQILWEICALLRAQVMSLESGCPRVGSAVRVEEDSAVRATRLKLWNSFLRCFSDFRQIGRRRAFPTNSQLQGQRALHDKDMCFPLVKLGVRVVSHSLFDSAV